MLHVVHVPIFLHESVTVYACRPAEPAHALAYFECKTQAIADRLARFQALLNVCDILDEPDKIFRVNVKVRNRPVIASVVATTAAAAAAAAATVAAIVPVACKRCCGRGRGGGCCCSRGGGRCCSRGWMDVS